MVNFERLGVFLMSRIQEAKIKYYGVYTVYGVSGSLPGQSHSVVFFWYDTTEGGLRKRQKTLGHFSNISDALLYISDMIGRGCVPC